MNTIEVKNLTKIFKDGKVTTRALNKVNLKVKKGEIHGLLGPNGAGKTTLTNILCTLLIPTSGLAKIKGKNVVNHPLETRKNVGVCFGGSKFLGDLTGKENLKFYGYLAGMSKLNVENRITELSKILGFEKYMNRKFREYSKGMKQKIVFAKALLHDPDVLLMDEPTIGLDISIAVETRNILKDLAREGKTILLTSHYLNEIEELCERITMISRGVVIAEGNIKNVKKKLNFSDNISFYIGTFKELGFIERIKGVKSWEYVEGKVIIHTNDPERVIVPLLKELKKRKIRFADLEIRPITLEDTVLKIMRRKK